MKQVKRKIIASVKKHLGITMIVSAVLGAIISWAASWLLPSSPVEVTNLPQKELTCTLDFFSPMVLRRVSDQRLQLVYNGAVVDNPYFYSITINNTGKYAITNADIKENFTIQMIDSKRIIQAQIINASNQAVTDEVLANANYSGTNFAITDFFLNPGESFTVNIITDGKPEYINYHYRIADISQLVLKNSLQERNNQRLHIMISIAIIGVVVIIITIIALSYISKKQEEKLKKLLEKFEDQE